MRPWRCRRQTGTGERAAEEIAGYDRELADIRGDLLVPAVDVGASIAVTAAIGTPALWPPMSDNALDCLWKQFARVNGKLHLLVGDVGNLKFRFSALEAEDGQLCIGLAEVNGRIDRIETRLERIERRLDLADAAPGRARVWPGPLAAFGSKPAR